MFPFFEIGCKGTTFFAHMQEFDKNIIKFYHFATVSL